MLSWLNNIRLAIKTTLSGMGLTFRQHFVHRKRKAVLPISDPTYFNQQQGVVTLRYPQEQLPLPDVARYRLHLEFDDCIACDQCARICPVDCILIEKVKAVDVIGTTSDGTKKRLWMPTFDIDLAKCCYCGLCTVVCPTECLTMTPVYDHSEFDRNALIYNYSPMTPAEVEQRKQELETFEAAKKAAKANAQ